jgi:hypothetical protein
MLREIEIKPLNHWRSLFAGILLVSLMSACSSQVPKHPFLPWDITVHADGSSSVFGVHLGADSLLAFKRVYNQKADLAIFVDPDQKMSLEAYFGNMQVGALSAQVAIVAQTEPGILKEWLGESHTSGDPTPTGARKYPLSDQQLLKAQNFPIESITYRPSADYSEALIRRHFGQPQEIRHPKSENQYWLYPTKGLLITVNNAGRDLFQYIAPNDFARLKASIPPDTVTSH